MAPEPPPLFTAITSSTRQLHLLLRTISFSPKSTVRISSEGLRFSCDEGSVMEAFVFLEKSLFTSYTYNSPPPPSSQDDPSGPPVFQINLNSLLETLNIFALSDPNNIPSKRPNEGYDAFAAHRLNSHTGINAFSNHALGMNGSCTFSYEGEGNPLSIDMSEAGFTTNCELTTYVAPEAGEDIPFDREAVVLKTIMRSSYLLDAVNELSTMSPAEVTITANPSTRSTAHISFSADGALGSATVEFIHNPSNDQPASPETETILETFMCARRTSASYKFSLLKSAQRAMHTAAKVSLRMDEDGVLSLQFLVEVDAGQGRGEGVAFVDFRVVPLVEGEGEDEASSAEDTR